MPVNVQPSVAGRQQQHGRMVLGGGETEAESLARATDFGAGDSSCK